jgi:hypothetical protein
MKRTRDVRLAGALTGRGLYWGDRSAKNRPATKET